MTYYPPYSFLGQKTSELPQKNRQCTDVFCALLFVLVTVAGIASGAYGLSKGNLSNIAQPYDSDGNACGRGSAAQYPYLFFNNPKDTDLSKNNICLNKCPATASDSVECLPNKTFNS